MNIENFEKFVGQELLSDGLNCYVSDNSYPQSEHL